MKNRQQGLTLMSFIVVLAVLGFFGYIAAKLWGPYYEFTNVKRAMDAVAGEAGSSNKSLPQLQNNLQKNFDVGYVESIDARIAKMDKEKFVIEYESRTGFVYNIDFVIKFNYAVALQ
ncbi:DUF4845 domain-containing protein [Arenimonas sp.]|uniref:DUF4845 domain-containing protein n=1 Tax=Arenimonas sp. TaxID=1872635 RepID=UPI0039E254B9